MVGAGTADLAWLEQGLRALRGLSRDCGPCVVWAGTAGQRVRGRGCGMVGEGTAGYRLPGPLGRCVPRTEQPKGFPWRSV